ncbi:MAG: lipoprotein [Rhodocyclaceae bacterium]
MATGLALTLAGCGATGARPGSSGAREFRPRNLAKADLDWVIEAHHRELFAALRRISEKLYRRNPREWRKAGLASAEWALARVWAERADWRFEELGGRLDTAALALAFDASFAGDRVLALTVGLASMIQNAFGNKTEFFAADDLDPQKLYDSARNLEIVAWRLANRRDARGELLLLSNEASNLSFEREIGRMLGSLDLLAVVLAGKQQRVIAKVIQNVATALFLPVSAVPR